MKPIEVPVTRIGNSRGVMLSTATLRRYKIGKTLLLEERRDAIVLRATPAKTDKLTWEQTAKQMAAAKEDWSEWDGTVADGLNEL